MNQEVLDKCIVLIGLDGPVKDAVSKALSIKLGMPELDFRLLEFCPMTVERAEIEIELAKRHLTELKIKSKFAVKQARKDSIKNQIGITKQYISDMQNCIPLREKYYHLPNFVYLGYHDDIGEYLKNNYEPKVHNAYIKKMENKLIDLVAGYTREPHVIKMTASASNVLQTEENVYYESPNKKMCFTLHKNDVEKQVEDMKKCYSYYKNIVYIKQPIEDTNYMDYSLDKEYLENGQFEQLATSVVDGSNLIQDGKINEDALDRVTDEIISYASFSISEDKKENDSQMIS